MADLGISPKNWEIMKSNGGIRIVDPDGVVIAEGDTDTTVNFRFIAGVRNAWGEIQEIIAAARALKAAVAKKERGEAGKAAKDIVAAVKALDAANERKAK